MNSELRDASYEEILHFVHGYGIQNALPSMQSAVLQAMNNAISNDNYVPLADLPAEDYDEEYLAINYYFRSFFGSLNTNFKVDKENNPEGIRFLLTIVLENKIGRYWYKNDFGKILLDPGLVEIADEICNDYE